MLKQFYRPKTRSSLRRQKLLGCLDGGHFRHEEQDAGLVISAWQHGTCLGCSPRGLEDYFFVLLLSFCVFLHIWETKFICGQLWTEKFKLWEEFYDCFSWLFKISFSFLLQVNISGVAMNHPAQEPLGPLQRFSFPSIRFRGPRPVSQPVSSSGQIL